MMGTGLWKWIGRLNQGMNKKRKTRLPWNWRSRVEITREDSPVTNCGRGRFLIDKGVIFRLMFKKGQTPKGFNRWIGELDICNKSPHFVQESGLDEYFFRRGLGTLLYTHALDQLGSLSTRYHSASEAAQGLWRLLVRMHRQKRDFFAGTLTIFSKGQR